MKLWTIITYLLQNDLRFLSIDSNMRCRQIETIARGFTENFISITLSASISSILHKSNLSSLLPNCYFLFKILILWSFQILSIVLISFLILKLFLFKVTSGYFYANVLEPIAIRLDIIFTKKLVLQLHTVEEELKFQTTNRLFIGIPEPTKKVN